MEIARPCNRLARRSAANLGGEQEFLAGLNEKDWNAHPVEPNPTAGHGAGSGVPLVEAHQMQLQQVRLNLVVNAFEAMRETPVIAEGQGEREV